MLKIVKKKTLNCRKGRAGMRPIAIVIHVMDGSLRGTDSWFAAKESGVSAHYGIGRSGEVHQYVDEADSAMHVGLVDSPNWSLLRLTPAGRPINPNYYTLGVEHEGKKGEPFTDAMYATSSELIAAIALRWSIPIDDEHVIPHHAIRASKPCPGSGVDLKKLIAMADEKHAQIVMELSQDDPPDNAA